MIRDITPAMGTTKGTGNDATTRATARTRWLLLRSFGAAAGGGVFTSTLLIVRVSSAKRPFIGWYDVYVICSARLPREDRSRRAARRGGVHLVHLRPQERQDTFPIFAGVVVGRARVETARCDP